MKKGLWVHSAPTKKYPLQRMRAGITISQRAGMAEHGLSAKFIIKTWNYISQVSIIKSLDEDWQKEGLGKKMAKQGFVQPWVRIRDEGKACPQSLTWEKLACFSIFPLSLWHFPWNPRPRAPVNPVTGKAPWKQAKPRTRTGGFLHKSSRGLIFLPEGSIFSLILILSSPKIATMQEINSLNQSFK